MRWAVVAVMLLLLLVSPTEAKRKPRPTPTPTVTPAPSPGCSQYPEPRERHESQAWWGGGGLNPPAEVGEHLHIQLCWPTREAIVTGTLHVDATVTVHHGDEATHHFLSRMRVNWRPYDTESGGGLLIDSTGDWDIPLDAEGNGSRTFGIDLNLASLGNATRRIRFNVMAGSDPNRFFVANELALNVRARTVTSPRSGGKGWYSEHGYQQTFFTSNPPAGPVSDTYCFGSQMNPGADGRPTVQHGIYANPDAHNGSMGLVIRQGSGSFSGQTCIDTNQLPNGPNRIVLMARDANLAGLLVRWIEVSN